MLSHRGISVHLLPILLYYWYLFLLSGRSRCPARNRNFNFFAEFTGPCRYDFIPTLSRNPPYIFWCSSSSTWHLSILFSFQVSFLLILSCTPTSPLDMISVWFSLISFTLFRLLYRNLLQPVRWSLFSVGPHQLWRMTSFLACFSRNIAVSVSRISIGFNGVHSPFCSQNQ